MTTSIALYSLWIIAVNGAIPSAELGNSTGTALSPLAAKIGGIVPILGIIYVILAMGMGSLHMSYGLFYQVREVLPSNVKHTIQFMVSIAPIFLLFVFVEWMLFTNRESFSGLIGILGVFLVPIMGGIFPILMLSASRRNGDYVPKLSFGFLGNPLVLTIVYLIYLGSVFIYGVFIWEDSIQRIMAIGVGIMNEGQAIQGFAPEWVARRGIRYVAQDKKVFSNLTVRGNVELAAHASGEDMKTALKKVVDLYPKFSQFLESKAGSLSGGQREILLIGRAVVGNPKILLIGEPTEGLAAIVIDQIFRILTGMKQKKVSAIIVEQNLSVVAKLADRIYIMKEGKIDHEIANPRAIVDTAELEEYL